MALVSCKECGGEVADSAPTCPKCGVVNPGKATGELIITRKGKAAGWGSAVQIVVDGQLVGEVKNSKMFQVKLSAGEHNVSVQGGGLSNKANIIIEESKATRYVMYFSEWGILGGGLNFKPE